MNAIAPQKAVQPFMAGCPDCVRIRNLKKSLRLALAALETGCTLDTPVQRGGPTIREILSNAING